MLYDTLPRSRILYKSHEVEQSFESFRKDAVILAGHYTAEVRNDEIQLTAKSLSYADCTQDEIEQIYSDLIDFGLTKLNGYKSGNELRLAVEQLMTFA